MLLFVQWGTLGSGDLCPPLGELGGDVVVCMKMVPIGSSRVALLTRKCGLVGGSVSLAVDFKGFRRPSQAQWHTLPAAC